MDCLNLLVQDIYRIKLPGPAILGEGKPENQNHAIIFTRGEGLQTIDMNQVYTHTNDHMQMLCMRVKKYILSYYKKNKSTNYQVIKRRGIRILRLKKVGIVAKFGS